MNLSRRGFLKGLGAAAATLALPSEEQMRAMGLLPPSKLYAAAAPNNWAEYAEAIGNPAPRGTVGHPDYLVRVGSPIHWRTVNGQWLDFDGVEISQTHALYIMGGDVKIDAFTVNGAAMLMDIKQRR